MTNLAALNRQILLDPCAAVNGPRFSPRLHLHEKPLSGKLHPLATGLALLELHGANADVGQLRECYEEGIRHCFVSGITEMDSSGSDYCHFSEERVNHQIDVHLAGRTIVLEFESRGSMAIMGATAHKHYPVELDALLSDLPGALSSPTALHTGWAAKRRRAEPFAYPEDSGGEIGGIVWKLTKIGGLPVEGPEIQDHNVGWENWSLDLLTEGELAAQHSRLDEESFCLLHYLEEDQARALGLARPAGTIWQPAREGDAGYYPDWIADGLDLEATWIIRDELIESYRDSTLLFDTLTVFIGASETAEMVEDNWRTPVEEVDEDEADEDAAPKVAIVLDPETRLRRLDSLFAFPVGATDATVPSDLTRIVANLQRLRRAAFPGTGAPEPAPTSPRPAPARRGVRHHPRRR